jgi:hypothetical protein
MPNLAYPELAELTPTSFPPATEEALWDLRSTSCSATQGAFSLQPHQRFLRRVLSPDAPTRGVLVVHGTGTGKTCTAIQVAEEYILRPEFQEQKVLVVASAAVQETFRDQLFDMSRVKLTDAGLLESKQCTGRRYLEMLQRIEQEPKNWANPEVRDRLEKTADKLISEVYEFTAYASFGNRINEMEAEGDAKFEAWVHATFDNRLLIIDEAHNIRPKADVGEAKAITAGLERLVKTANGLILVLLTATPMYESYDEILLYFNLFLWNERKQPPGVSLRASDLFDANATLREDARPGFERLCQEYVSYVKGENPFTFPFRLPAPPSDLPVPTKTWDAHRFTPLQFLTLIESPATGIQAEVLQKLKGKDDEDKRRLLMQPTVAVLPNNADFGEVFTLRGDQYAYRGEPFLGPATLAQHSAKFARVIRALETGEGIVFVYSNYVKMGAELFAMALEEHGYGPVLGRPLLATTSYTGPSKGKYALLTSSSNEKTIAKLVSQARSEANRNGEKIRVLISSPIVAEGVDFRCVRQAHILDPWWNMSRIEQVIGRSLRTCSHTLLTNEQQNCTVYLHAIRTPDRKECYDGYTYRTKVEPKAMKIAKVRTILERAAMDCPLRVVFPPDWLSDDFRITQRQSEGREEVAYSLKEMLPPTFLRDAPSECTAAPATPDPAHVRPLSAILDVRDELLDKLGRLLMDKPIWDKDQLLTALTPYQREVSLYTIQQAIDAGTRFRDAFNRQSVLESKGDLYALRPIQTRTGTQITSRGALSDRLLEQIVRGEADLPSATAVVAPAVEVAPDLLATKRAEVTFPGDAATRFSQEVLDAYVFDHRLTEDEKRAYLRATPDFGPALRVTGTDIFVRGFQRYDPDELPIGDEKERVDEWTAALATTFSGIIAKGTLFASLTPEGKFTLSKVKRTEDGRVVRAYDPASKTFLPTTCGTGAHPRDVMLAFAATVDSTGSGIPAGVSKVPDICTYCELLARAADPAVCAWIAPEQLSVLYDDPALRKRFTAEFKVTKTDLNP